MYISIDRSAGRFLHKHPDFNTVCNLAFIEAPDAHVDVAPVDSLLSALAHWTELECSLLYRTTTGEPQSPYIGTTLRAALQELGDRLPVTDADAWQASAQAGYVEHCGVPHGYLYVKGSSIPVRKPDLWNGALRVTVPQDELGNAARKHVAAAQQRAQQRTAATPAPVPSTRATAPNAAARTAQRPRSGVCKQIWEVLDAERAKGDAPSRARVKELATQHGWNANTASVQSAAWRKQNGLT
jgi:pyruvate/2-oxoglutarate dehydrogenase complex dihydrolipoamide acyltransferase (E2) component